MVLHGPGSGTPYPARHSAVLQGFAEYAAEQESMIGMAVMALGTASG